MPYYERKKLHRIVKGEELTSAIKKAADKFNWFYVENYPPETGESGLWRDKSDLNTSELLYGGHVMNLVGFRKGNKIDVDYILKSDEEYYKIGYHTYFARDYLVKTFMSVLFDALDKK